ncbi:MAG: flagellar export chaperone FliS [Terriglobales bacterium]
MNPVATYQRRAVEGATPIGLMVLLYQAMVVHLRKAIAAMETDAHLAQQIEARTRALHRVLGITGELRSLLREDGGDLARYLEAFYALCQQQVLQAVAQRDPEPLRALLPLCSRILEAWRQLEERPAAAASETATWTA